MSDILANIKVKDLRKQDGMRLPDISAFIRKYLSFLPPAIILSEVMIILLPNIPNINSNK
jgi:uncharacterized membrane protein